ncbi:MAG: hypothetical protein J6X08_05185, partial [Lachnospiraceae bacterium]|nr:hypothetical protein [Lachnospiraceae bacterium]
MALFVYITEQCREDAKRHSYNEALANIKEKLEVAQNIALFDAFPPPYLVRKKFGDTQGRLIAARRDVTVGKIDHTVIILLAILIRGDRSYAGDKGFGHDPEGYGKKQFHPIIEEVEPKLVSYIIERTKVDPPPEKPELSEDENLYLDGAVSGSDSADDVFICETREWIESIENLTIREIANIGKILESLYEKIYDNDNGSLESKGTRDLPGGGFIHYEWVSQIRQITLISLNGNNEEATSNDISHTIFRTYPAYMTLDEGIFIELEKETYGNLALSDEEQRVLRPNGRAPKFPMFINGRAGSGKSTILQYLFAEYYARYSVCGCPFANPPAYFACNEELIRKAREFVSGILRTNRSYSGNNAIEKAVDLSEFQNSFKVFRTHLLSLLKRE